MTRYEATSAWTNAFEAYKWTYEIPYIQWPSNWLVKAIPPTTGAVIRYFITKKGKNEHVSIYLDCYDMLGCVGQPYWEICPYNGDTYRCLLHETDDLKNRIRIALCQIK